MKLTAVGVAKVKMLDIKTGGLVGDAFMNFMKESTIEVTTANTEQRGGDRNTLIDIYYHTPNMAVTLTSATLNMEMVAANLGATYHSNTSGNVFSSEQVTLTKNANNVTGTVVGNPQPIVNGVEDVKGWITYNETQYNVIFTAGTKNFITTELPASVVTGTKVCCTYYNQKAGLETMTINSSIIPKRVRVIATQAVSSDATSEGIAGYLHYEMPIVQLSGAQTFTMSPESFSDFNFNGTVLSADDGSNSCGNSGIFANVSLDLNDTVWFEKLERMAVEDGKVKAVANGTYSLNTFGIYTGQSCSDPIASYLLDYTVTPSSVGTINNNTGVITFGATATAGTITIKPKDITVPTAIPAPNITATVTVVTA